MFARTHRSSLLAQPHCMRVSLFGATLALLSMSCSKKESPNLPDPFPDLHVVSVAPADKAVNVTTATEVAITFSQRMDSPISMAAAGLGMMLAPPPPDFYQSLELSSDRRQVLVRAPLAPGTNYSLVVFSAYDRYDDILRVPFASVFHTASSAPTASVSGNAIAPFNAPTQGFVGLLRQSLQAVIDSDNADQQFRDNLAAVSSIKDAAGAYEIQAVAPGTYWPFAVLDVDRDGRISLQGGDRLQGYDANGDAAADAVTIAASAISNIQLNTRVARTQPAPVQVESYAPANGSRNLPVQTEFRLTFNAALDTSKFGLFISPEPAGFSKASLALSADSATVSSTLSLQANASYSALLFAANGAAGQVLQAPFLLQFATANEFPAGEVSGQVVFGLSPDSTKYTLVGLLREDVQKLLARVLGGESVNKVLSSALEAMGFVPDESGSFTITYVRDGTYWPVAAKDFDGDGTFDLGADPIGIFDGDGDGLPSVGDSVVVRNGEPVRNVMMKRLF